MRPSLAARFVAGLALLLAAVPALAVPCTPGVNVLCLDDQPGDRRFAINVNYETTLGGGFIGAGKAQPLSSLGVTRGGLFWFFGQDNPEILVKVLNGCGINNRFWVYLSAITSVGFNLTVTDTLRGSTKSYQNPDLQLARSVNDTAALSCNGQ